MLLTINFDDIPDIEFQFDLKNNNILDMTIFKYLELFKINFLQKNLEENENKSLFKK